MKVKSYNINTFKRILPLLFLGGFCIFMMPSNVHADSLTLLQSTDSPANGATIAPTLDLTSNLYTINLTGATWNPLTAWEMLGMTKSNGNYFGLRTESSKLTFYSVRNYVTYSNNANLLNLVSGTKYNFEMDVGQKHIRLFADGVQILYAVPYRIFGANGSGGTVTTEVFDPINPNLALKAANNAIDNISVYQRDKSLMTNLVLLGDSITLADDFEKRLSSQLTRDWFISNHSRGYRQSRELRTAILSSSLGDRYNPGTMFYPDVAGFYESGMASNKVLIGVGTNDLLWSNNSSGIGKGTPDGANTYGPEEGGYVAVDAQDGNDHNTINNILGAIDDIISNNPGWKVYFRTPLNTNGYVTAGYAAGEAKRQVIRTSALSGLIKTKIESTGGVVIDQDNVFAPAASRTDGAGVDGALYNPTYWPPSVQASGYSNNTTNFDAFKIHPITAGYNAIADYIATKLNDTTAPTISSIATTTASTTATITWTTSEAATSTVRYGSTSSYGLTAGSDVSTTTHSVTLTSLQSETSYHFQISVSDSSNNLATSSDLTLLTLDVTAPTISSVASPTTETTATITFTTDESATSTIDYGTTTEYGTASSSLVSTTSTSFTLTGLSASTLYHYRISAWDDSGNLATSSDDTFTTSAAEPEPESEDGVGYRRPSQRRRVPVSSPSSVSEGLRPGMTDPRVKIFQQFLNSKGFFVSFFGPGSPGNETDFFGAKTQAASIAYQQSLVSTSMTSEGTPLSSDLEIGVTSPEVKTLQKILNVLGYVISDTGPGSPGNETDFFGAKTKAAVLRFQTDHWEEISKKTTVSKPTGMVGEATRSVFLLYLPF